jgi:hypothetical protein
MLPRRQQPPRLVAIAVHLFDQRIEQIELRFGPQEVVEGHLDLLPIEIAGPVEEMGSSSSLGGSNVGRMPMLAAPCTTRPSGIRPVTA